MAPTLSWWLCALQAAAATATSATSGLRQDLWDLPPDLQPALDDLTCAAYSCPTGTLPHPAAAGARLAPCPAAAAGQLPWWRDPCWGDPAYQLQCCVSRPGDVCLDTHGVALTLPGHQPVCSHPFVPAARPGLTPGLALHQATHTLQASVSALEWSPNGLRGMLQLICT